MASKFWIKLYIEILDDPKMGKLPDFLFRRAIELFLLAGENGNDGLLQPVQDLAWRLRISETKLTESLSALSLVGVVHETPEGWVVSNFSKRQEAATSTERVHEYRKRNASETYRFKNETHIEPETESDTETESDSEKTRAAAATGGARKDPLMTFYSENIGSLTQMIGQELSDLEAEYSTDWVISALQECVRQEARNLKYATAILKRWKTDGKGTRKGKVPGPKLDTSREDIIRRVTHARKI